MTRLFPRALFVTGVSLVATTACEDGKDPLSVAPAVVIRDSADIRIVENHAPDWDVGESWTVAAEPTVVIGGYRAAGEPADSSHLVWSVADIAALSDGRVAVLSSRGKEAVPLRAHRRVRAIDRAGGTRT